MSIANETWRQPALVLLDEGFQLTTSRWRNCFPSFEVFYEAGNAFLLLAHIVACCPRAHICSRLLLLVAFTLLTINGYNVVCSPDVFFWNLSLLAFNFVHVVVLLVRLWPSKFHKEIEELYVEVFQPLRVSRRKFKKLITCMKGIKKMKYRDVYAQEKVTKVDCVSVVLSGKLVISQQGRALHIVFPHQFLDSPEWFGVSTDDFFQVSITAIEDSRILLWHRDKLKFSIMDDKFLQTALDHILGRDVVNKLIQANEAVTASANGHLPNSYDDDNFPDGRSLMIVKRNGDNGSGITALVNRQTETNDFDAWRLGKIDEAEFETPV